MKKLTHGKVTMKGWNKVRDEKTQMKGERDGDRLASSSQKIHMTKLSREYADIFLKRVNSKPKEGVWFHRRRVKRLFYCCDKAPRPRQLREARVYLGLWFHRVESPLPSCQESTVAGRQAQWLKHRAENSQIKLQAGSRRIKLGTACGF